jgi:hypothetical protein
MLFSWLSETTILTLAAFEVSSEVEQYPWCHWQIICVLLG